MRKRILLAAALALGAALPAGFGASAVWAQNYGQRVVNGVTENADSAPLPSATVFLRNTKTKAIRSFTTAADGHFRFAQVSMSEDFELWAEKSGKKSAVKTISSWDTRKEVDLELKVK
jgi:hypothetical protein